MKLDRRFLLSIVIIVSTLAMACQCQLPSIFLRPTPTPTFTPTPPPEPLPPQVVQVVPERGEEQPLDAPLRMVFDQPMDQESVEAAFTIEPAIAGEFEWPSARTMQFKPLSRGFKRATKYTVTV